VSGMYKGEDEVIKLLSDKRTRTIDEIAEELGMNIDHIRRVTEILREKGYVKITQDEKERIFPTDEFLKYLETKEMPEYTVYKKAEENKSLADLSKDEKSFGIRWAKLKGYLDIEKGKLVQKKSAEDVGPENRKLIEACLEIKASGSLKDKVILDELFRRKLVEKKTSRTTFASWTGKTFKADESFDISVSGGYAPCGKNHPLTKLMSRIKNVFSDLGFSEMEGDIIQSSFWNFDALFQPQDHPARELADTFYIDGKMPLPDKKIVDRVKKEHEKGWGYKWDPKDAEKVVLRTHTTALSAKYLSELKKGDAKKFFSIGRVFRNEATDFKHLAEFYQVEGIISWEKANFRNLLGVLKEFYSRLGFEKIRFRPSYFPYTEPSLEVEIFFEPRKEWLEMGGAGIFRPEVSIPLADTYPVLAWGLSLERPLMLMLGLEDIRTFYRNDADFLKKVRL